MRRALAGIGRHFVAIAFKMPKRRSRLTVDAGNWLCGMGHHTRCQRHREQDRKHDRKPSHGKFAITHQRTKQKQFVFEEKQWALVITLASQKVITYLIQWV